MKRTQPLRLFLLLAYFGFQFVPDLPAGIALIAYLTPFLFVLLHSLATFGKRDTVATFGIIAVISFAFEAVGTNTGVPFGNYIYPESVNGPLLFGVPPLLTLAYIAMAYASLWIARILLSRWRGTTSGRTAVPTSVSRSRTSSAGS